MTPTGPNEQPTKPDWVLSNLYGRIPEDVNEMRKTGDFVSAFGIKEGDDYWKLPDVQKAFTGEDGTPQKQLFDDFYKNARKRYEVHTNSEINFNNLEATFPNEYTRKINAYGPRQLTLKGNPDPYGRAFLPTTGYTEKQQGIRETAIETGVRLEDGSYVHPAEYDGYSKFATEHDGSFKLDQDGRPFLEPVRDGEELKSYEQIYSSRADFWGYYGHDYEAEQIVSFLPKNLYSFVSQTIDSIAEFPKTILGAMGAEKSEAYKDIVDIENWAKSMDWGKTEKGQDFFSVENLTDLGLQVTAQLAAMWATGGATTVLTGSSLAGSVAGKVFMAAISAGDIAEVARENNLTYNEQLALLGVYSAAVYGIAGLDDAVIKGFNTTGSKAAFREMIAEHAVAIKSAGNSKSGLLATMKDADLGIRSLIYRMGKTDVGAYATSAGAEALEESAEAATLTALKASYNVYNDALDSGEDRKNKFNIDWLQEAKNVGYSAVGGALGGLMARKIFNSVGIKNPKLASSIWEMVADGKEKVLYNNLDRFKAQNRLGLAWRAPDGTLAEGKVSENDASYNIIKSVIDYNVELRESLGLQGLKEINNTKAGEEAQYVKLSSVGKDAANLGMQISNLETKLQEQGKSDPDTISRVSEQIETKRRKLSDILEGRVVDDYIAEGAFNFTTLTGSKHDSDVNFRYLNGKSFVELYKSVPSIMAIETQRVGEELKMLKDKDDSANLDNFEGISQVGKARVLGEAQVAFHEKLAQSLPGLNQGMGFEENDQFFMDMTHNLKDFQDNMQSIVQGEYDDATKKVAADLMLESAKLQVLEDYNPVPTPKIPTEESFYRNMVEKIDDEYTEYGILSNTPVPIQEMLDKENQLEKDSMLNGVSMYMNSDQVKKILDSIRARIAQLKGVVATRAVLPASRAEFVTPPIDANSILKELKGLEAEASRLLRLSEDNLKSSDLRIKQATIQIINKQLSAYEKFATIAISKPEFQGVRDILKKYQQPIYKAVTQNDVDGMLRGMMMLESETFDLLSTERDTILKLYEEAMPEEITLSVARSGKYNDIIESYNYVRGILSEKASKVMSAYEKAVNKSQGTLPAVNQDVVARAAVHALQADKYSPGFYIDVLQKVELSNSVMIHSEGGAGKTSQVIPIIVGMMQELNGGRVFLTSQNNDGGKRITNLRRAVRQYYSDKNSNLGINTVDSDKSLVEFLKDSQLISSTNLIVFDEATLLTFQELREVQKEHDRINTLRKQNNQPLLKILFTGDNYQNNANTDKSNPDSEINGIGNTLSVRIATTPELSFSFRSLNQSLKLFNDYVRSSQFQSGYPKQVALFEYQGSKGVRVFNETGEFESHVVAQAKQLAANGEIAKAILVTDKSLAMLSPEILNSGIQVLTSEAAQGNEWDYVFFDPSNNNLFAEGARNLAVKKDFYTASTRAKRYFVTTMPKEQMIASRSGVVYDLKPLSADQNSKDIKLESVGKILEGFREDLGNSPLVYSEGGYNVVNQSSLFSEEEFTDAQVVPDVVETAPATKPTDSVVRPLPPSAEKFADFLSGAAYQDSGMLPLYTFFTPKATELVDQADAKKKAIYDTKGQINSYQYFVTIAKIGTPKYHTVIKPDAKYNGTYAAFVEAAVDNKKVVIGVLPQNAFGNTTTLDKFISDNDLLGENDEVSYKINNDVIMNAQGKAPIVFDNKNVMKSLRDVVSQSPNINFGRLKVFTASDEDYRMGRAGKAFIPTSFVFSQQEIDDILAKGQRHPYISFVELNYKRIPFEEAAENLRQYVVGDNYAFDASEAKNVYNAFWGNMTKRYSESRNAERFKPVNDAFADILKKVPAQSDYYNFLSKYATPVQSLASKLSPKAQELIGKEPSVTVKDKSYFFMADYLTANAASLPLFQKAISDLYAHESYKDGFRFDLQLAKNSTGASSRLFADTLPIPQSLTDQYLEGNINYVSMPILKLDSKALSASLVRAKPEVSNSASIIERNEPIEMGPFPNETIPFEDYDEAQEEFDKLNSKSLIDFKDRFFPDEKVLHMRPTIDLFRRTMFDKLFVTKNVDTPYMNNINKAVKDYQQELEENVDNARKFGFGLDDDASTLRYYNLVIRGNFDFLLSKYFPVVTKEGKDYIYKSNHFTDQSWFDKENYSHLHQGMTEMVKMLLFNTPLITARGGKLMTSGRYLNFSDIEEVINELKEGVIPTTAEEFAMKLSPNYALSDASRSLYYRYFSPTPVTIDGLTSHSLQGIRDADVWKMVDSFRSFFMSGQPYALTSVDLTTGKNNLPISIFGTPNLIRQHGYDSMNAQMKALGDDIIYGTNTVRINGETWFKSAEMAKRGTPYTNEDVVRAMHLIGLSFFSKETLADLNDNGLINLDITPGEGSEQRLNNRLIDNVFFETSKKFVDSRKRGLEDVEDSVITSYTNAIFKSVARRDGMNNVLMYTNLDDKRVYRLRNTAPIFTLKDKILKIRQSPTSPLIKNTFVTGDYSIRAPFVKEGFKTEKNGRPFRKSSRQLFPDEMFELDFFWGFLDTIEKSFRSTGEFKTAAFPIMAYSDGSTMMDLVIDSKSGFMGSLSEVVKKSFESQQQFYVGLANDILRKWSPIVNAQGIQGLKTLLDRNPIPTEQIEKIPGMIVNRDYTDNKGFATIKQTLVDQMEIFSDINNYIKVLDENFDRMKKAMRPKVMENLQEMLKGASNLNKFTPDTLLKSFFIHWAAISNDIQLLTNGEISNFKGKTASAEYIEMVKRAKSEVSTHNTPIFRNESWIAQVQKFLQEGGKDMQQERPDLFYEGHKLNKTYNVAFVHDPIRILTSISGETKNQEVYDGATFVTPLTRIFQRYSNGHEHGMLTPPVMKNITTYYDPESGNKMFIKNAEFELTPEIIRNGTQQTIDIVKKMLGPNIFAQLTSLGVNPDLSNVQQSHFEELADNLVKTGQQDEFIMELIPNTSVKTGRRATTSIAEEFIPTQISITSKGSQLDASKNPSDGLFTRTPTQMISAMSTNWRNPEALRQMFDSIEAITNNFLEKIPTDLQDIVRKAVQTREGILYSNQLVRDENFSLDDRQVLETLVANFNSMMVSNSISTDYQGGHYVVHPSDGLIEVYDTPRGIKLKSELLPEEAGLQGRPLKWSDPVNKAGVRFMEFRDEAYVSAALEEGNTAGSFDEAIKVLSPDRIEELASYFQTELSSGNWTGGEAEILLPADMANEFMLEPGKSIESYNRLYFTQKILSKNKKATNVTKKADAMFRAFTTKLHGVMSRIPGTGKHSVVNTKVVGFVNDSLNSVFVPSMLLFIQGADQDVDKAAYLTYQSVGGVLPELDATGKLANAELFSTRKKDGEMFSQRDKALIAGYKNKVVDAIRGIMGDAANAVEANISVDSVMSELKAIRDERQGAQNYNRYDYTSLSRMIQVNQSGKRLVGTFANGLKAYQNLYTYYKLSGKPGPIADLDADFNKTWITFAGFINASTDNAKEQILGAMGINDYNAGIVAYLIAKGQDARQINDFLLRNKEQLDAMNSFNYYDSEYYFNADTVWGANSELTRTYKLAREYRMVASAILNTAQVFPKRAGDMYAYKNNIETWVKETYQESLKGPRIPFDLIKFMNDEDYANQHIKLYDKVIATSPIHEFNFLEMIKTVPHLRGYMKTYTTALEILQDSSRVINLTNRLADDFRFPEDDQDDDFVKDETYRDMMDFVYGGLIDSYFKSQDTTIGKYKLSDPAERTRFVRDMNSDGIARLKEKYPENSFVRSLFVEEVKRGGRKAGRMRTYDLMSIEEEKLLEMQVMFHSLAEDERRALITYSMIVDKNKMGKGSWSQLLEPVDMKDFNDFVQAVNPETLEMNTDIYRKMVAGDYSQFLNYNAIPYSFETITDLKTGEPVANDVRDREPVQMTESVTDLIQSILPSGYAMSTTEGNPSFDSPIEIVRGRVKSTTTAIDFLRNLYKGNLPESADLDQVDKERVKAVVDYYDKMKNEINFTYDKTKQDMKSCGIKIKAV